MKEERKAEEGYVHLIHPSTFFLSFLPLLMIACTLPPLDAPAPAPAATSNNNSSSNSGGGSIQHSTTEYIQRGNTTVGEGEPNYQSTPPPPCTKTLPRRQRRLPPLLLVGYHPRHV